MASGRPSRLLLLSEEAHSSVLLNACQGCCELLLSVAPDLIPHTSSVSRIASGVLSSLAVCSIPLHVAAASQRLQPPSQRPRP